MSVYHKEKASNLRDSLNSMLNQTIQTNDLVLVCDGPLNRELDSTIDEFVSIYSEILNVVRLEENMGLGIALNAGLKECKNDIVFRMDTDDISTNDRCEIELREFIKSDLDLLGSNIYEFTDSISNITGKRDVPSKQNDIIKFSRKRNPFNHPSVVFRRDKVLAVGGYSEEFHLFEDYHLWVRMLLNGAKAMNISQYLLYMRTDKSAKMRRGGKKYAKDLIRFNRWLKQIGWISNIDILTGTLPHAFVCLMPNFIRAYIYKILR